MSNTVSLVHDVKGFIHSNGSVADKLRLVSAGVELDKGVVDDLVKQLESVLNKDGGVNIADARYLAILFTNPRGAPCHR